MTSDVNYPLTNKTNPTVGELKAAWVDKGYIAMLENLSSQHNKPIVFTEIGYESRDGANMHPASSTSAPLDLQEQADCYQAALEVLWGKPWLHGIFWWQWWAGANVWQGGVNDGSFTPYGKPAEQVLRSFYLSP